MENLNKSGYKSTVKTKSTNPQKRLNQNEKGSIVKRRIIKNHEEEVIVISKDGKCKKEIYFSNGKNWWIKEFEMCGNVEVFSGYQSEKISWKRTYVYLEGEAYQTSHMSSVGDFSKSKYEVIGNRALNVYNENNKGWKKTEYMEDSGGIILEYRSSKEVYIEEKTLKNYKH